MLPSAPLSPAESARRARPKALDESDGEPDALLDSLAEAAAAVCETPVALVVLAGEDGLRFMARVGLAVTEVPHAATFCDHVVRTDAVLQVCDATADERLAGLPLVSGPLQVRFYAGAPLRRADGVVIGALSVLDRTPRTLTTMQSQALRKLAASVVHALEARARTRTALAGIDEARLQVAQLHRSTPIPLFSLDPEGRLLHVSDAFVGETGFARDELLGTVIFDLLTPGSRQRALDVGFVFHAPAGHERREYQVVRKDGTVIDILASHITHRDPDGRFIRTVGVFENVTAARRAERELREESRLNARLIEATNAGTWELDCRTHRTRYNERWAAIIGYTLDELGETTLNTWASRVHPHDLARVEAAINAHADSDFDRYSIECRLRRKDGSWVWILDHACVTERDASGRPSIMQGVCTDITVRKETEDALRASQAFLERVGRLVSST